ncbi:hypothetical protein [Mesorhizobium sp. KR1-2]|uniref:hypothetical protein n=1 Tax=Mesorhizobium sp. KR1-2 TaxID=3156609 RepID=UPI0032B3733A
MTINQSSLSAFSQLTGQQKTAAGTNEAAGNSIGSDLPGDNVVPFVSKSFASCPVPKKIQSDPVAKAGSSHLDHIAALTAMELRKRYPREAISHKNMLSRRKLKGAIVHPDFVKFTSFLGILGPMPAKKATLDRIDNNDPEYAPGKVRWADKKTQNSNKSDTLIIHDAEKGLTYSVSQLANLQSVPADTIRKRKARGWTDAEIIAGAKAKPAHAQSSGTLPIQFSDGLYSPKQLAALMRPVSSLTHAGDIAFYRDAHFQQGYRDREGEEYFPALYDDMIEPGDDEDCHLREGVERHIAKLWPSIRPHVIFANLTPAQQQLVAKIDPEYVANQKTKSRF